MENHTNQLQIDKIDSFMKIESVIDKGFRWLNPKDFPETIRGFAWFNKEEIYRRLPKEPRFKIPEAVDTLADCTSGGQIRFTTDARKLAVKVRLSGTAGMVHMPATGQCGFDCYMESAGKMKFYGITMYNHRISDYEYTFFDGNENCERNIILNFPLYQGVQEVWVGVDEAAAVFKPYPFKNKKRAVFYGTSITQGGCASRPGMSYTNILSRLLDTECINLGFSGNGKGEPELAKIIGDIDNIGCIVLDYEANTIKEGSLKKTLGTFIEILREVHKEVPILVLSKIKYANEHFSSEGKNLRLELAQFQKDLVDKLRNQGDANIYFYDGSQLLGDDFDECTVDGVHPTDLGFSRMAYRLVDVIHNIMG